MSASRSKAATTRTLVLGRPGRRTPGRASSQFAAAAHALPCGSVVGRGGPTHVKGRSAVADVSTVPSSASPRPSTPIPLTTKVGLAGLVLVASLGATSGISGVVVLAGLYLAATGAWAVRRRRSWLGRHSRGAASAVLAGGLVLVVVGGAIAAPSATEDPGARALVAATATPDPVRTPTPAPTPTPPTLEQQAAALPAPELAAEVDVVAAQQSAAPQTALAVVALLEVKGRAPKTGYDRDLFGSGWVDTDRNGCDTRNDMLARDLENETFKPGTRDCVVLTGTLADPYSGTSIAFTRGQETSNAVQIDHVVALSDAWQKGAQGWDEPTRVAFANDPLNLLAVDGPLNMQKRDGDTATWLPPHKPYRCAYVARQVGVKHTYGLWVTEAERNAMVSVLSTCAEEPLPAGAKEVPAPAPAPAPAAAPAPAPAPAAVPAPAPAPAEPAAPAPAPAPADPPAPAPAPAAVHYKNCAAARAAGAAPVRVGEPGYGTHLDRDGDGIGCES
ncbi:DUF1524 domain-containing protein [Cellulomonas sp. zg-ZUI199]|uniref:DUF1524 domain-containing protein n=1 Tax=Cellulomonas wangleii TaxID=2816956 RepID=A0ABX8DAL6_9CELL|nr:DUF1524 domain-containing protein [Cellulomonas wangleii]QVI63122.1 DUF1524 domain-containing protein [Cellulomonas wangleii]